MVHKKQDITQTVIRLLSVNQLFSFLHCWKEKLNF